MKRIKLTKDKFRLRVSEAKYMGHVLSAHGIRPDPAKVQAILEMERPRYVEGVRRVLGMVNYLARYTPNLSDLCEQIRQLTRPDIHWDWTFWQEQPLQQIKGAIIVAPVLRYFHPAETTVLQCDASSTGLDAVLMQNGQPVTYASRALTKTEREYAQIQRELLAIVLWQKDLISIHMGDLLQSKQIISL